jgi:ATP-dependent DNA helicase RecG
VETQEIREGLQAGTIKVVVGTHTLIEDPVLFSQLELVVIDEQHRFGVGQRAALRAKGTNPHLLVMTATPIPRSLSLTIYGDLDLSVIDEMPPGRQEVSTHLLLSHERERAYKLIRREVAAGHQAFIIYPLIEESESSQATAAVDEQKRLKKDVFPDFKVELLHGRLNAEEKDKAMAAFRDGKAQVMVSTTVIEVGVDIPNATVMLIEGATRFGLAQLHQLRGRVGRGAEKAYCILIPDHEDAAENERLQALLETNDGFILAEKDLAQRGPGQFLGKQQSGFLDFRLASLSDARLIDKARLQAELLLGADPNLSKPEHSALSAAVKEYFSRGLGDVS